MAVSAREVFIVDGDRTHRGATAGCSPTSAPTTRAPWVMAKPWTTWARPGEVVDGALGWRFTNPPSSSTTGWWPTRRTSHPRVRLAIAEHLESMLGERFAPPQLLLDKAAAGELGSKSGRGFHDYPDGRR